MKRLNMLVVLFIAAITVAGCSSLTGTKESENDDSMMMEESHDAAAGDETVDGMAAMENADILVELQAENFTYGEDEIRVNKDSVLTLKVTNASGTHDLVIDELGIDTGIIAEGDFVEVTIPTDKVGEFSYYCSVGNHRAQGMEGTLIIQ